MFAVGMAMDEPMGAAVKAHPAVVKNALAPWDAGREYLNFAERATDVSRPRGPAALRAAPTEYKRRAAPPPPPRGRSAFTMPAMAKKSRTDELFDTLRLKGLRKRVTQGFADLEGGGRSAEKRARALIKELRSLADALQARVDGSAGRKEAAKKAAATRKRQSAKRSAAGRKAAQTRKRKAAQTPTARAKKAAKKASRSVKRATKR